MWCVIGSLQGEGVSDNRALCGEDWRGHGVRGQHRASHGAHGEGYSAGHADDDFTAFDSLVDRPRPPRPASTEPEPGPLPPHGGLRRRPNLVLIPHGPPNT